MSQVDGLIRLMEGPNTGPINLEKPRLVSTARPVFECCYFLCWESIFFSAFSHLSEYIYIPGEFTMTEVVETVKEVGF